MRRRHVEVSVWIGIALLPFATALVLAAGASGTPGSFYLRPSFSTLVANIGVVTEGDPQTNIRNALLTSFWLGSACSAVTTLLAIGAGAALSRLPGSGWIASTAFVGSRVVPTTAALPLFAVLVGTIGVPKGLFVVAVLYVLLFLPLATALLSGARWREAREGAAIVELDGSLPPLRRLSLYVGYIGGDLIIASTAVFLLCWSEFFLAAFLLQPGEVTLARYFSSFETINGYMWGPLGAAVVLSVIPVLVAMAIVAGILRLNSGRSDEARS